ncbi:MAG: hypothetical protein P0S95_02930 [Rhabdochlamydiaceae bacterium]|nr:hypothetical protein [Candidatus Amphrikana amoebophyrae]
MSIQPHNSALASMLGQINHSDVNMSIDKSILSGLNTLSKELNNLQLALQGHAPKVEIQNIYLGGNGHKGILNTIRDLQSLVIEGFQGGVSGDGKGSRYAATVAFDTYINGDLAPSIKSSYDSYMDGKMTATDFLSVVQYCLGSDIQPVAKAVKALF